MKCQSLLSGKIRKQYFKISSAGIHQLVKVFSFLFLSSCFIFFCIYLFVICGLFASSLKLLKSPIYTSGKKKLCMYKK